MTGKRQKTLCWLRWLLVIPAAIVGFYLALAIGVLLLSLSETVCSADAMQSGHCYAPWFGWAEEAIVIGTSGLTAWLVVLLPSLTCPHYKRTTATLAYGIGAAMTIMIGITGPLWIPAGAALLAGLLTLRRVYRQHPLSGSR